MMNVAYLANIANWFLFVIGYFLFAKAISVWRVLLLGKIGRENEHSFGPLRLAVYSGDTENSETISYCCCPGNQCI